MKQQPLIPTRREYNPVLLTLLATFLTKEDGNGVKGNIALAAPKTRAKKTPEVFVSTAPTMDGAYAVKKNTDVLDFAAIARTHERNITIMTIEDDATAGDPPDHVLQIAHVYANDVLAKSNLHTGLFGTSEIKTRAFTVMDTNEGLVATPLTFDDIAVIDAQPLITQRTVLGAAGKTLLLGTIDKDGDVTWTQILTLEAGITSFTHLSKNGDSIGVNLANGKTTVIDGLNTATNANMADGKLNIAINTTFECSNGKIAFGPVAGVDDVFAIGTRSADGVTVQYVAGSKQKGTFAQALAGSMTAASA